MGNKRESLDFNKPLYAFQEFPFFGTKYKKGDLFDWQKIGCSKTRVAMLHNSRRIRHQVKTVTPQTKPDTVVAPQTQLPKDPPPKKELSITPVADTSSADPIANVTAEPATDTTSIAATLEHTGAGWYNVEVEGLGAVNDAKLKGKEAAAEWAKENGYEIK